MEFGTPKQYIKPVEKITREDISRVAVEPGETEIIMQRHEKYIRDLDHERAGGLDNEDAEKALDQTVEILKSKLNAIPVKDHKNVNVLVIASDTKYGKGMRSFETATQVVNGVLDVFGQYGLNKEQLLNTYSMVSKENVIPSKNSTIQEPKMFTESPEFVEYLKSKYGNLTQQFWQAFEEDWEKEEREKLGAEGPKELLERYSKFIQVLKNFSDHYHRKHPNKILIIWPVSHYDTISPYVKNRVVKSDPNHYLPVDYGAGISLKINKDGKMSSKIQGEEFSID